MLPYGGITLGSTLWLPCDGSTRLKADYPNLYNAILTTYGPETATTFTLPDTRGRVLAGADNQGPLGAAGRLTAAGFASAVLGAVGGNQLASYGFHLPAIGVAVGQWFSGGGFSGTTTGAQSVNINTGGPFDGGTPVTGGGGAAANAFHQHNISGNTGGEALGFASFGASGGTNAYDGGTNNGANVQPTLIIRHIIKT
jgi:microcystin-dependent protein